MTMERIGITVPMAVVLMSIGLLTACGTAETNQSDTAEYLLDMDDMSVSTEADKDAQYMDYLEEILADDIMAAYSAIKSVDVTLSGGKDEMQADICLELQDNFTEEDATKIAKVVATAIEDEKVENVVIQDREGNVIFPENY